jgi:hypothetical protein
VKAKSGQLVSKMSAELRVKPFNKHPTLLEPRLHLQITENTKPDVCIGWLRAVEPRMSNRFRLIHDSPDFFLNSTSGQLNVKRSLDRERQRRYELRVELLDSNSPNESDEGVVVVDVMDV